MLLDNGLALLMDKPIHVLVFIILLAAGLLTQAHLALLLLLNLEQ